MLQAQGIGCDYGATTAVEALTFTLEKGRIYGLLGCNGAGKSTTMNLLAGYLPPTRGRIIVNGLDLQQCPEKARANIGYLPEIPPLYPDMTPVEYLGFVARLRRLPRDQARAEIRHMVVLTGLSPVCHKLIRYLSKGYCQRVGLAGALLGDPEIVILDEPTVGLDPRQITEIRALIRALGPNHTVLLSSHILTEVSEICDHIMILSGGRLAAAGTPTELDASLRGQIRYHFRIRAEAQPLRICLQTAGYTAEVQQQADTVCSFTLQAEDGAEVREAVFRALAAADLPILELYEDKNMLENVFLTLTE